MRNFIVITIVSILALGNLYGQIKLSVRVNDKEKTVQVIKSNSNQNITTHTAYLNDGTKVSGKMKASFSIGFRNPFNAGFTFVSEDGATVEVKNIDHVEKNDGHVIEKSSLRIMHYTSIVVETVLLAGLIYVLVVL